MLAVACGILLIFGMKSVFSWKPSDVSQNCMRTLYSSIHDVEHHTCDVVSMGNNFTVHYVEHAGSDCVNPNFPAIHIVADVEHTAWMQVVSTDSEYQRFIDAGGCAPFYNFEKDFYDSPLWAYGVFRRPTSFWKAHAYAVFINRQEKTIECVGGGCGDLNYRFGEPCLDVLLLVLLHNKNGSMIGSCFELMQQEYKSL